MQAGTLVVLAVALVSTLVSELETADEVVDIELTASVRLGEVDGDDASFPDEQACATSDALVVTKKLTSPARPYCRSASAQMEQDGSPVSRIMSICPYWHWAECDVSRFQATHDAMQSPMALGPDTLVL